MCWNCGNVRFSFSPFSLFCLSLFSRFQQKSFLDVQKFFMFSMLLKHFPSVLIVLHCRHRFSFSQRKIVLYFNDVAPHNDKDVFFHNLLQFEFSSLSTLQTVLFFFANDDVEWLLDEMRLISRDHDFFSFFIVVMAVLPTKTSDTVWMIYSQFNALKRAKKTRIVYRNS